MINTLEIVKRVSELLKPKVNVAVPVGFSDNFESFKVEGLPKLKDRFLNGIFINKIRESGKTGAKRQVKECTNDRLERRGGFPPGRLGFTMVKPVACIKTRKTDDVQKRNLESQF